MLQLIFGVVAGLVAWFIGWFGSEKLLSAILPDAFGTPQQAFQDAITNGGQFTADTRLLLMHLVIVSIVSAVSGCLAALVASGNPQAPVILSLLLLAMAIAKAVMSWSYVPIWYHLAFTVLLIAMTIIGGRSVSST
jgi:hypothetical protein